MVIIKKETNDINLVASNNTIFSPKKPIDKLEVKPMVSDSKQVVDEYTEEWYEQFGGFYSNRDMNFLNW